MKRITFGHVFLAAVLVARLHLSFTRYFDTDEFAHLHWSWLLTQGYRPYRDFFMNVIPFYHWVILSPVFLLPYASSTLLIARLVQYLLYLSAIGVLALWTQKLIRNSWITGISILLFTIFPMTLDKTLEIRPDMLMTLLIFLSMALSIDKEKLSMIRALVIGTTTAMSILSLPKIVFALPAVFLLLQHKRMKPTTIGWCFTGFLLPFLLFFIYLQHIGSLSSAYEHIVPGSLALKAGEGSFSLWLTLSPFPLVYLTSGGISLPWIINTLVWIAAFGGIVLYWKKEKIAARVLALFLSCGFIFLYIFPTPYTQYFIPLSMAASVAASIFLYVLIHHVRWKWLQGVIFSLFVLTLSVSFWQQYRDRIVRDNTEQLRVVDTILAVTKPTETVYDMVGSYVFRPDGAFICCNVYSQFSSRLPHPPPPLRQELVSRQTKFIVLDRVGKSLWLPTPDDLSFMEGSYLPSSYLKIYTLGAQFQCKGGSCTQFDLNNKEIIQTTGNSFSVIIPEVYRLTTLPSGETVTLDGKRINDESRVALTRGDHAFWASPTTVQVRFQLAR